MTVCRISGLHFGGNYRVSGRLCRPLSVLGFVRLRDFAGILRRERSGEKGSSSHTTSGDAVNKGTVGVFGYIGGMMRNMWRDCTRS